jgi:CubicO group peptidase (beta-lactamase class C family)
VGTNRDVLWRSRRALSYDAGSPSVRDDTVYDLASLTKILSTAPL